MGGEELDQAFAVEIGPAALNVAGKPGLPGKHLDDYVVNVGCRNRRDVVSVCGHIISRMANSEWRMADNGWRIKNKDLIGFFLLIVMRF